MAGSDVGAASGAAGRSNNDHCSRNSKSSKASKRNEVAHPSSQAHSTELSLLFRDANSFIASSREAIERSASHIYISALPFTPKDSLIYQTYFLLCTGLVSVDTHGIDRHAGWLVMTLTGHESSVHSVAYSPVGQLLGSGSADGSVRI